ncbi:uncharacterized protein LACBIDRAFT_327181 [Laccaria bicolor S238N-H82]|uniref:Predicted protein n=1 Tax=Laccaria bicolor (strain S238N-H82 / ATCC MYA-4686) TaxID=486041 RepID=B0DBE6_LACBS|nr:uncharacterized protein LACBIDRAFT_327181 [Laccaria bicolor S238N-H82]EDR07978.1 predicted protein [Laccaria bicolor S238N-H82]|eukprot:XP_001881048.1 predicted protein [Laccaria bicolor S238N-H82]
MMRLSHHCSNLHDGVSGDNLDQPSHKGVLGFQSPTRGWCQQKHPPLVISEDHRTDIPAGHAAVVSHQLKDDWDEQELRGADSDQRADIPRGHASMESPELEDGSDEQESNGTESGSEEQTSEFEEGEKDMTGIVKSANERNVTVEIEGVVGESGDMAVTDVATNVTIDDVGLEKDSVHIIYT